MKLRVVLSIVLGVACIAWGVYSWAQYTQKSDSRGGQVLAPLETARITPIEQWVEPKPEVLPRPTDLYEGFVYDVNEEKKADSSTVSAQFFGDIMLDRNVAKVMGGRGLDYVFEKVSTSSRLFGGTDFLIANLEGPFAPTRIQTSKTIAFRFDPKLAASLKQYGFSAVSLANNHTYDMGRANVPFTRATLKSAGVGYFGDELLEGEEYIWYGTVTTTSGAPVTIAFVGLHNTYHNPNLGIVEKSITEARKKASYIVVNVHWGDEYKRISNTKQRTLAHWLIDHGADAVIGHHPHVIQEMELYNNKPIFYSLGNFIFDQYFSQDTQEGLSVGMTFANGEITSIYLFPFYSVKSQVYCMEGERRDAFLEWMQKNSRLGGKEIIEGKISL